MSTISTNALTAENQAVHRMNNELRDAFANQSLTDILETRRLFSNFLKQFKEANGAQFFPTYSGGVPTLEVETPSIADDGTTVIHYHSGGYVMGSARDYRPFGSYLSEYTRAKVILPDYRLAPENPFPAAITDGFSVYESMLESGYDPSKIILSGDSAGGGLALVVLQWIRDRGLRLPAGAVSISPVADFTNSAPSREENDGIDPFVRLKLQVAIGEQYCAGMRPDAPSLSPLFGDWRGLPPVRFYAGSIEVLRDDAKLCAEAALAAGVDAVYTEGKDMVHIWPIFADRLVEAAETLTEIGDFIELVTHRS